MMYQNGSLTLRGDAVFNAIWSNASLRESLFSETKDLSPLELIEQKDSFVIAFIGIIISITNPFYNFIKIK